MMTESEFKLYMTAYLDKKLIPVKYQIKELENRMHRLEALLEGKISIAFPYTNTSPDKQPDPDDTKTLYTAPASDQKSDSHTFSEEETTTIMDFLKIIQTDVTLIKQYVVETKPSFEDFTY